VVVETVSTTELTHRVEQYKFMDAHASPSPEDVWFSNMFGLTDLGVASSSSGRCSKDLCFDVE
jgi:hypothetical protein